MNKWINISEQKTIGKFSNLFIKMKCAENIDEKDKPFFNDFFKWNLKMPSFKTFLNNNNYL